MFLIFNYVMVWGFLCWSSWPVSNTGSFLFVAFNVASDEFFYISGFVRDAVQLRDNIRFRSCHYFQAVTFGVHAVKSFLRAFPLF